jgi:hypothetical protein
VRTFRLAAVERQKSGSAVARSRKHLQPDYQLSLELVFDLYLQVFERIDPANGTFTSVELNPSPAEMRDRVMSVVNRR